MTATPILPPVRIAPEREKIANEIFSLLLYEQGFPRALPYAPDMLVCAGALAGFALPITLWNAFDRLPEADQQLGMLHIIGSDNGNYYFGPLLNKLLVEGSPDGTEHDIPSWSFIGGGVAAHALDQVPAPGPILAHVASKLGGPQFMTAPIDAQYQPRLNPREAVDRHWIKVQTILQQAGRDIMDWRLDVAYAAARVTSTMSQQALAAQQTGLSSPKQIAELALWAAVVGSRFDPRSVKGALCASSDMPEKKGLTTITRIENVEGGIRVGHALRNRGPADNPMFIYFDTHPGSIMMVRPDNKSYLFKLSGIKESLLIETRWRSKPTVWQAAFRYVDNDLDWVVNMTVPASNDKAGHVLALSVLNERARLPSSRICILTPDEQEASPGG